MAQHCASLVFVAVEWCLLSNSEIFTRITHAHEHAAVFFLVNFLFGAVGITLIALTVWALADAWAEWTDKNVATVLIVLGALILGLVWCGCCGAVYQACYTTHAHADTRACVHTHTHIHIHTAHARMHRDTHSGDVAPGTANWALPRSPSA